MIECAGCHRFIRASETSCPFCGAGSSVTSGAGPGGLQIAFAAGLSLLACTGDGEDSAETNAVTTDPSTSETASTMGDGDGDTQEGLEYTDYGGSDYGGPPPCEELDTAIPLMVGSNAVDTSMSGNGFVTDCGALQGSGPDQMLEFVAAAEGVFTISVTADFDAWLLTSSYYCYTDHDDSCAPNNSIDIQLGAGEILYLVLDGATDAGGVATVDVTQE